MKRTCRCPYSISRIRLNLSDNWQYIFSIVFNSFPLTHTTVVEWNIMETFYSQNIVNWPWVIQRLNHKDKNFNVRVKVLDEHTILFGLGKLFYARRNRWIDLLINDLHQVFIMFFQWGLLWIYAFRIIKCHNQPWLLHWPFLPFQRCNFPIEELAILQLNFLLQQFEMLWKIIQFFPPNHPVFQR